MTNKLKLGRPSKPRPPCTVPGCERFRVGQGLCRLHYYRTRTHGAPDKLSRQVPTPKGTPCIIEGCDKPRTARGLCHNHYKMQPDQRVTTRTWRRKSYPEKKEKWLLINKHWRQRNPEYIREKTKKWQAANPEKVAASIKKWEQAHPEHKRAAGARRRARKIQAQPKWVSDADFLPIYAQRIHGTEIDHIIPLVHKNVCGLHVPWNLRLLTKKENRQKSNQFDGTYENESWRKELNYENRQEETRFAEQGAEATLAGYNPGKETSSQT